MTDFSVEWLALRAPADDRARAKDLVALAAEAVAGRDPVEVVDLGSGTGATLRALSPELPTPQHWTLVDSDPALLEAARTAFTAADLPGVTLECREANLAKNPAPWKEPPSLVTASALFDLVSRPFIGALVKRLASEGVPLLAMLSYNGVFEAEPEYPDDAAMSEAFNAHQRGQKSFGIAAGPDGASILAKVLENRGYRVEERDTPWVLEAGRDDALIAATLKGWAAAANELHPTSAVPERWLDARLTRTDRLVVGHTDVLGLPGSP